MCFSACIYNVFHLCADIFWKINIYVYIYIAQTNKVEYLHTYVTTVFMQNLFSSPCFIVAKVGHYTQIYKNQRYHKGSSFKKICTAIKTELTCLTSNHVNLQYTALGCILAISRMAKTFATPARSKSGWSTYVCQSLTGGLGLFTCCGAWLVAQLRSLKQPQDQGHQMPLAVVALQGIHLHQLRPNVWLEGILWTHCLIRGTMIQKWGHKYGKSFHSCSGLMKRVKAS